MPGLGTQPLQAGEVGQRVRFGPCQLFGHQHMFKVLAKAHGVQHVLGVQPRCVGHHAHADVMGLGMLQQAQQARHRFKRRRHCAEQRFLAVGQRLALFDAGAAEQLGEQLAVGAAADLGVELRLAQLAAVVFAQQLAKGLQVQGVSVGEGTVKVEQQGGQHGISR